MIRVLVADDQALVRDGFRALIDREDDIEVVGDAADGIEAVEASRRLRPDVVLMDIRMPGLDGIEATRRILTDKPAPRILMLTTFDRDDYLYQSLRAGASGFLLKDVRQGQLTDAIRTVAGGEALLAPAVTRRLIEQFCHRPPPAITGIPNQLKVLTEREITVLTLIAKGLSNIEIGHELHLSESTVKTHVARVLMKLGLRDRVQGVVVAYESGLVEPGSDPNPSNPGGSDACAT